MTAHLRPCPFCGGAAEFERVGTGRQSCIVACSNCGCRLETSETWSSGAAWNERTDATLEAERDALRARVTELEAPGECQSLHKLRAEVARLRHLLAVDTPWPAWDVLRRLADAADHLLTDHSCDRHGYEEVGAARDSARAMLERLAADAAQGGR